MGGEIIWQECVFNHMSLLKNMLIHYMHIDFGESAISNYSFINSTNVYRPVRQALCMQALGLCGSPVTCRRQAAEWATMSDADFGDKRFKGRMPGAESEAAPVSGRGRGLWSRATGSRPCRSLAVCLRPATDVLGPPPVS